MPIQSILLIISLVLFLMASFYSNPRVNVGWLAMAFFVASFLIK